MLDSYLLNFMSSLLYQEETALHLRDRPTTDVDFLSFPQGEQMSEK
jgi:hypothetical protein